MKSSENEVVVLTGSTIKHFDYYQTMNKKNKKNPFFLYKSIDSIDKFSILDRHDFKIVSIVEAHSKILQIKNPKVLVVNKMNYKLSQIRKSRGVTAYTYHQFDESPNWVWWPVIIVIGIVLDDF